VEKNVKKKKRKGKKEREEDMSQSKNEDMESPGEEVPAAGGEPEETRSPLGSADAGEDQEQTGAVDPEVVEPEESVEDRLAREAEQWQDKYLRLMADFENYKKRAAKEKANLIQYGNETLLKDLLPVIDNMERVLAYSLQEGDWKDFQRGVELVVTEIHKTLSKHGVHALQVLGVDFDPNLHEAMQRLETDQAPPDTVVEEFQKGYLFRDRLLRPSLVAVAASSPETKGMDEEETPEDPGDPQTDGKTEGCEDEEKTD
jgi:molecular chaperone GrpE